MFLFARFCVVLALLLFDSSLLCFTVVVFVSANATRGLMCMWALFVLRCLHSCVALVVLAGALPVFNWLRVCLGLSCLLALVFYMFL